MINNEKIKEDFKDMVAELEEQVKYGYEYTDIRLITSKGESTYSDIETFKKVIDGIDIYRIGTGIDNKEKTLQIRVIKLEKDYQVCYYEDEELGFDTDYDYDDDYYEEEEDEEISFQV